MRLIDAEVFEEFFNKQIEYGATDIFDAVDDALQDTPTISPDSLRERGNWESYTQSALIGWKEAEPIWADRKVYRCSRCARGTAVKTKFCPSCGARMETN